MKILDCLVEHFRWIEDHDLHVGTVFLNPAEITLIKKCRKDFKAFRGVHPEHDPCPGILRGYVFGVPVREVLAIPPGKIAILPEGIVLRDIGPAACVTLGLDRPVTRTTTAGTAT